MSSSWFSISNSTAKKTLSKCNNIRRGQYINPHRYWGEETRTLDGIPFDLYTQMDGLNPVGSVELDVSDTATVSVLEDLGAASTGWEHLEETAVSTEDFVPATSDSDNISVAFEDPDVKEEVVIKISATDEAPPKKRRGRKPKPGGSLKSRKIKKQKLYEVDQPFQDEEEEKKRLNAIKAKNTRDRVKQENEDLKTDIEKVKTENEKLQEQVAAYKERVQKLENDLSNIKRKFSSLVSDIESTS